MDRNTVLAVAIINVVLGAFLFQVPHRAARDHLPSMRDGSSVHSACLMCGCSSDRQCCAASGCNTSACPRRCTQSVFVMNSLLSEDMRMHVVLARGLVAKFAPPKADRDAIIAMFERYRHVSLALPGASSLRHSAQSSSEFFSRSLLRTDALLKCNALLCTLAAESPAFRGGNPAFRHYSPFPCVCERLLHLQGLEGQRQGRGSPQGEKGDTWLMQALGHKSRRDESS